MKKLLALNNITSLCKMSDDRFLTAQKSGAIQLWRVPNGSTRIIHQQLFQSNIDEPITMVRKISDDAFVSITKKNVEIWKTSSVSPDKSFSIEKGSVNYNINDAAVVNDKFLAISGDTSLSSGAVDIWDLETGALLHRHKGIIWRPHDITLAVKDDFLIVNARCRELAVYRVSNKQLEKICLSYHLYLIIPALEMLQET